VGHEAGEQADAELRVALDALLRSRGALAALLLLLATETHVTVGGVTLELFADVDREGREVVEVEALQLVIAEDHEDVRVDFGQLLAQGAESVLDARGLALVLLEVVHRDVFTERAARPYFVPALWVHVAKRAVCSVENPNYLGHSPLLLIRLG
jgi:hypothetical protein